MAYFKDSWEKCAGGTLFIPIHLWWQHLINLILED